MKIQNPFKLIFQKIRTKITKDIVKKAVYLAFIFLFVNLFILITNNVVFFVYKDKFNNKIYNTEILFNKEFLQFLKLSKEMASTPFFVEAVQNKKITEISEAIKNIKNRKDVLSITVIDKDGKTISGVDNLENSDNYIFQAIKWKEKIFSANIDIDIQRASDIFLSKSNDSLFLNNQEYFIDKLYLEELASEDGAIFLFYKFNYFSKFITPSFIASLFFTVFLLYLLRFRKSRRKIDKKIIFLLFVVLFLTIVVWNNILYYGFYHPAIKLKKAYEYRIYNSVLKFDPEYAAIDINNNKKIAINLLSGGEAINAVKAVINYDPKMVKVDKIITDSSFCKTGTSNMFIEKNIDNENGQVSIVCGLPNPGFSQEEGILAELIIEPLQTGQISLRFGPESQVLANDGLGTNVLRDTIDSSYFAADLGGETDEENIQLFLFSYTHPNSETWYRNKNIDLFWQDDWASEYYYLLDNSPFSIPDGKNKTDKSFINFTPKDDGVYYFHIGGVRDGIMRSVYHYKVKIDSSPPEYLHLKVNSRIINNGEIVRTEFESRDAVSGIEPNLFYIKLDDSIYLPTKSPLYIPFNKAGNHMIYVKVYDRADNYIEDSIEIKVKNTPFVRNFINIFVN